MTTAKNCLEFIVEDEGPGIPLQEIAWVATFSFCWSVMLGYACDVKPTALPARRLPEEELRRP